MMRAVGKMGSSAFFKDRAADLVTPSLTRRSVRLWPGASVIVSSTGSGGGVLVMIVMLAGGALGARAAIWNAPSITAGDR